MLLHKRSAGHFSNRSYLFQIWITYIGSESARHEGYNAGLNSLSITSIFKTTSANFPQRYRTCSYQQRELVILDHVAR